MNPNQAFILKKIWLVLFDLFDSILIQSACLTDCLAILVLSCQEAVRRQPRWPGHHTWGKLVFHWDWPLTLLLCVCVCVCQWDGLWRKRSGYPYTVFEWGALGVAFTDWMPLCHSDVSRNLSASFFFSFSFVSFIKSIFREWHRVVERQV